MTTQTETIVQSYLNDVFDLTINRVEHPWRVIPMGLMSRKWAVAYYVGLLVASLAVLWAVGLLALFVGVFFAIALLVYSWRLRQINGPASNVIIAMTMGCASAFGGFVTSQVIDWVALTLFVIGFFLSLAREILGDTLDLKGDSLERLRTIPMTMGIPVALRCSAASLFLLIICSYIPLIAGEFSGGYAFPITFLNLVVLYSARELFKEGRIRFAGKILKVGMFCYPLIVSSSSVVFM